METRTKVLTEILQHIKDTGAKPDGWFIPEKEYKELEEEQMIWSFRQWVPDGPVMLAGVPVHPLKYPQ
jgi:hypothetical protein